MLEWLFISHDPLLAARWSIIETFLIFWVVFMIISWTISSLVIKLVKNKDDFARKLDFDDFKELRFFFMRDTTFAACNFLMFIVVVYTFTHQADIILNYKNAILIDASDRCTGAGGFLTCSKSGLYGLNISGFLSNFTINSTSIEQHTNASKS